MVLDMQRCACLGEGGVGGGGRVGRVKKMLTWLNKLRFLQGSKKYSVSLQTVRRHWNVLKKNAT